jgi:signal transduction histidine kinase
MGQLLSINKTLDQAMNSIRESVYDLHDDSVDLRQAVIEITKAMQENYHINVDYDMTRNVPRNVKYWFITTIKDKM